MSRLLFAFYYPVVSFCRLAVYCSVYRFIFITCYLTIYLSMVCHLVPIIFCRASSSYYRLLVFLLSFCHLSVTVLLISCYRFVVLFRSSQRIRHGMEVIVRGILHEVIVASLRSVRFVLRSRHLAFLFFLSCWKQIARIYHVFWPHEREDPVARTVLRFSCKYKI
jgi:hypothetical protein